MLVLLFSSLSIFTYFNSLLNIYAGKDIYSKNYLNILIIKIITLVKYNNHSEFVTTRLNDVEVYKYIDILK